jgi:hypothetical protein
VERSFQGVWQGLKVLSPLSEACLTREAIGIISELQKLIRTLRVPTNWRLMSDGIYNQLGVLSGRLRGYDGEYELTELIEKRAKKKDVKP